MAVSLQDVIDYMEWRNQQLAGPDDIRAFVCDGICDKMTNEEARELLDLICLASIRTSAIAVDFLKNKLIACYGENAEKWRQACRNLENSNG